MRSMHLINVKLVIREVISMNLGVRWLEMSDLVDFYPRSRIFSLVLHGEPFHKFLALFIIIVILDSYLRPQYLLWKILVNLSKPHLTSSKSTLYFHSCDLMKVNEINFQPIARIPCNRIGRAPGPSLSVLSYSVINYINSIYEWLLGYIVQFFITELIKVDIF